MNIVGPRALLPLFLFSFPTHTYSHLRIHPEKSRRRVRVRRLLSYCGGALLFSFFFCVSFSQKVERCVLCEGVFSCGGLGMRSLENAPSVFALFSAQLGATFAAAVAAKKKTEVRVETRKKEGGTERKTRQVSPMVYCHQRVDRHTATSPEFFFFFLRCFPLRVLLPGRRLQFLIKATWCSIWLTMTLNRKMDKISSMPAYSDTSNKRRVDPYGAGAVKVSVPYHEITYRRRRSCGKGRCEVADVIRVVACRVGYTWIVNIREQR
jgi:hypothetical protein